MDSSAIVKTWYFGVGPVNGNEINMRLYTAFNVAFMADNLEGNVNVELVGTLDLVFRNCNQGKAFYATESDIVGSGEFRIKRINSIYRSRCSGEYPTTPLQMPVRQSSKSG